MIKLAHLLLPLAALATVGSMGVYAWLHANEDRRQLSLFWRKVDPVWRTARFLFYLQSGACLVLAAMLCNAILTHRFDIDYVFSISSTTQPLLYLFAAFWGGQEGTFLLWACYGSVFGLMLLGRGKDWEATLMMLWCIVQLAVLGILLVRSPFAPLDLTHFGAVDTEAIQTVFGGLPPEGGGLNPLLQNPWMAIHPPLLFLGFASMALPFVFALAGLIRGDLDGWGPRALPWTLGGFAMLGLGLILGGYWAYEMLGWGGYWAWDPVENSSLVPWLFAGSLFHGLVLQKQTGGALRRFNLLVAGLCFASVAYGSYLNRSGVLVDFSVHSFVALSPAFNRALSVFASLPVVLFVAVFLARGRGIEAVPVGGGLGSRKQLLHWITLLLFACGLIVLIGNSWPLVSSLAAKVPGLQKHVPEAASLQPEFYNRIHTPVAMVMGALLSLAMLAGWNTVKQERVVEGLRWPLSIAFSIGVIAWVGMRLHFHNNADRPDWMMPSALPYATVWLTVIVLCALAACVNGQVLIQQYRQGVRGQLGTHLAHTGFMVMVIAMVVSSVFETGTILPLPLNQPQEFAGYELTYTGLESVDTYSVPAAEVRVIARRGSRAEVLSALIRSGRDGLIRSPGIRKRPLQDLYLEPGEIESAQNPGQIVIDREHPVTVGDLTFTFRDFDLGDGHLTSGNLRVGVELDVTIGKQTTVVKPWFRVEEGQFNSEPVDLPGGGQVAVIGMPPMDDGSGDRHIVLSVTGRELAQTVETAVMQVRIKPLMSLVWLGCWLTITGALMSAWKRFRP